MTFKCENCEKSFDQRLGLEQHVISKNHGFVCEICKKMLLSSFSLTQHTEAKHKKWECKYCNKSLETRKGLKLHLDAKHFVVECKKCKKRFLDKNELKKHIKSAHTLHCNICGETLKERDRSTHMREVHFQCPCGENCGSREELHKHIDTVHNVVKVYSINRKVKREKKNISLEPDYS